MFNLFKKEALGLDISDRSIEIISLGGTLENPQLLAVGRAVLEPGIVENGKLLDKEKLKDSLQNLIKNPKLGEIKTKKFIFSLPESRTFIHIVEFPEDLKKREELEFIESQASQTFPYSLKDLHLDFKTRKRDNLKEVLLVAAPKNIVDDYLEVFKSLKLHPFALETESESLGRSLIQDQKETTLIADIGMRTTNFSIFDEKELRLSVSIEIAGNRFTQSLAENLKISRGEAETLKKEVGLNPEPRGGRTFLILQKEVQGIIWEIREIEKYFQKKENKKIKKIILAGGSALLPRLSEYLTENLERPASIGNPWNKINIDIFQEEEYFKKILEINPILYATCIGSALRGLAKNPEKTGINLIKEIKAKKLSFISTILAKIKRSPFDKQLF
ncbi:MAG: type IV pilus assembly protein PilM [Candidatus Paceibacterales bacterium]